MDNPRIDALRNEFLDQWEELSLTERLQHIVAELIADGEETAPQSEEDGLHVPPLWCILEEIAADLQDISGPNATLLRQIASDVKRWFPVLEAASHILVEPSSPLRPPTSVRPPPGVDEETRGILRAANAEARHYGHPQVEPEHLLLVLLQGSQHRVGDVLRERGVSPEAMIQEIKSAWKAPSVHAAPSNPKFSDSTKRVIVAAYQEASRNREAHVMPKHLMLSLSLDSTRAGTLLRQSGISDEELRRRG